MAQFQLEKTFQRALRSGIRALGYDIIRYAPAKSPQPDEDHGSVEAPFAVFFLGAQGVGKTSLASEVAYLSKNQAHLITQEKRLNPPGSNWVLPESEIPPVYEILLKMKLQATVDDNQRSIYSKFVHLYWMYWVTVNHIWLKSAASTRIPLVDSSFFQQFAVELCDLQNSNASAFLALVSNSIFIHCVADARTILDHIATRERDGRLVSAHWGKDEKELEAFTKKRLSEISRFIGLVRNVGVPCLEIDTSREMRGNAQRAWDFIRTEQR